MVPYRRFGEVAERPHLGLPAGTFEEELGLDGFFGPVSHLYHRHPPTSWASIKKSTFQWEAAEEDAADFLRPQCFEKITAKSGGDFFESHHLLFWNEDVAMSVHNLTAANKIYFRNADANELFFCHDGHCKLESIFGSIDVKPGDYVSVPKGVTYRWITNAPVYLLRIESFKQNYRRPDRGLLGQQALYHEEGMVGPHFDPTLAVEKSSVVRVQSGGKLTDIEYAFDIRALSGWMGNLYPWKLPVEKIAPVMSHIAHIPPSINSTFVTDQFIVCTFLPRPLEEPEAALKVPFFHSNIDYDEVIFYHAGDFFSRDNMAAGYITLHPRGINHGPHPKALANQSKAKRTNEIAVMIDTIKPLKTSGLARSLELQNYWKSWQA